MRPRFAALGNRLRRTSLSWGRNSLLRQLVEIIAQADVALDADALLAELSEEVEGPIVAGQPGVGPAWGNGVGHPVAEFQGQGSGTVELEFGVVLAHEGVDLIS